MNLKNKKVIITGATGGIGNSLVKKFYDNGSTVLATGTKEDKLDKLKSEFNNIKVEKLQLSLVVVEIEINLKEQKWAK